MTKRKKIIFIIILLLIILGIFFVYSFLKSSTSLNNKVQESQIEQLISARRQQSQSGEESDPFGKDNLVKILFIGLDNRIGQTNGHCDAIQLIEINRLTQKITITAVPRGTYSPLPGTGHLSTDYYVSKACEIGGIDYGVKQIEKILGQKPDYVVFVGFSEAIGIFRQLKLPTTETMQWLRLRQGYAIGEPQRARNHSTFIKQMIIKFTPQIDSGFSMPVKYLMYKLVRTDITFKQAQLLAEEVKKMDTPNHPERIQLLMRPAYAVQDIAYDPEKINEYVDRLIKPIAKVIPEGAYSGQSQEQVQQKILDNINNGLKNPEFVIWAYQNYAWLQLEDETQREQAHFDLLNFYLPLINDAKSKDQVLADYIIEMEDRGFTDWAQRGKDLLNN
ncbi:MAG: hypothetical protein NTZ49_01285 [Candidatus Parcubacteria bacterium]|nr:hypothetical protein [Candidatus Parcubacteria bacterium]